MTFKESVICLFHTKSELIPAVAVIFVVIVIVLKSMH